jgi:hypothetical protein
LPQGRRLPRRRRCASPPPLRSFLHSFRLRGRVRREGMRGALLLWRARPPVVPLTGDSSHRENNAIGNATGELGTRAVTAGPRRATRAPCSPSSPVLCCCLLRGGKVPACQRERRRAWGRRQCAEVGRRWRAVTEHCRSGGRGRRSGVAGAEDKDGGALPLTREARREDAEDHNPRVRG